MKKYDFVTVFRIYPGISKSPAYHSDDKLKMVELMLDSFKASIDDLNPFIYVLLDACPVEYEELFKSKFSEKNLEIIKFDKVGNYGTFNKQIEILSEQDKSDIVYFAEDDYLYRPGKFKDCVRKITDDPSVDFISPYDHSDYYSLPLHDVPVHVTYSHNNHWREAGSTCLTFITRKSVLKETAEVFRYFSQGLHDAPVWMILTRFNMFSLSGFFKLKNIKKSYARWIYRGWKFGWRKLLFGKKYSLYVPIPAAGTHLEGPLVSPGINWDEVVNKNE